MEHNKEEAFRIKEIAEKKFSEKDIIGAKRLAVKAQNLYPELDGLPQLLATLDVHIAADNRKNGEVDWYGVLGVEPSADDATIQRHYSKLALILHPDKSKAVGADKAFKIVSEAWSLLSDKGKRIAYDQIRNIVDTDQKVSNWKPSVPTGQNGFNNLSKSSNSNARAHKRVIHRKPTPPHLFSKLNTFWTICNACKTQFEYHKTYLNHNLLCQNCCQSFIAVEKPPPPINGNALCPVWTSDKQGQNSTRCKRVENPHAPVNMGPAFQSGVFSKAGDVGSAPSASSAAQSEKWKRKHEEDLLLCQLKRGAGSGTGLYNCGSSSVLKGDRRRKRRGIDEQRVNANGIATAKQMASRNGGFDEIPSQNGSLEAGRWSVSGNYKLNSTRELPQVEIRKMLMEKAKKDICEMVKEWSCALTVQKASEKEAEERRKQKVTKDGTEADAKECSDIMSAKSGAHTTKSSAINAHDGPDANVSNLQSMSVPDPDFHDFDKDRTEKSFGNNQVWAAYDDDDGMPRYYAMIHSVISRKPFKMRMSWLNAKSNRELGPVNWIGSGFYKTSGDFYIGKHEINKSLNSFSHKVKWLKGTRGAVHIYPGKGDVWALYRNWSPDWNEHTPDEVIHKYDMVEVLEDYNEERGVTVAPLVKVAGFRTVFRQHSDPSKTRTIPREELFRFSHQVPSVLLTGQGSRNAPKGCLELDPASTPLELLQVLTAVQSGETETAKEDKDKCPSVDIKKSKEEQNVDKVKGKVVAGEATREDKSDEGKETGEGKVMVYKRRRLKE